MQDLNKIREELKKTAKSLQEKKRQQKMLKQKLKKLKAFKQKKLGKLCIHFIANDLKPIEKLLEELKSLEEVISDTTTEGKAMLSILNTLKPQEDQQKSQGEDALA